MEVGVANKLHEGDHQMKIVSVLVLAIGALGALAILPAQTQGRFSVQLAGEDSKTRKDTAFYCNRLGVKPELRKHKAGLDEMLQSLHQETRELLDGFEFKFPSDAATFQSVSEWAALERQCYPFFEIDLRLERENGPFWLRLTGREGVKPFIRGEFAPWMNR